MNLDVFTQESRPLIEEKIDLYFQEKMASHPKDTMPYVAVTKLYEGIHGGKMIRGLMTVLGYKIGSKIDYPDIYTIAVAIEIMHTALLIHDDIMDNDFIRRGRDTIYHQYQKIGKIQKADDPKLYGQALALCVGDIAFFMAYDLLAKHIFSLEKLKRIIAFYSAELYQVGYAQMMDVHYGQVEHEPTLEEIIDIYRYKTARYTFTLPLTIGGILGDMNEQDLVVLQNFGEELGIIFQIRDDELGIFGSEAKIGKAIGSDIRENKKTLLRFLLLQKTSVLEKKNIADIFGRKTIEEAEIEYIRKLMNLYNIREEINKDINDRTLKINSFLSQLSIDAGSKKILEDLVEYNLRRTT